MYYEISHGKLHTILMLEIIIVTSLTCLYTFPVSEAYFRLSRVKEVNLQLDKVLSVFNFTHTDLFSESKEAPSFGQECYMTFLLFIFVHL